MFCQCFIPGVQEAYILMHLHVNNGHLAVEPAKSPMPFIFKVKYSDMSFHLKGRILKHYYRKAFASR